MIWPANVAASSQRTIVQSPELEVGSVDIGCGTGVKC